VLPYQYTIEQLSRLVDRLELASVQDPESETDVLGEVNSLIADTRSFLAYEAENVALNSTTVVRVFAKLKETCEYLWDLAKTDIEVSTSYLKVIGRVLDFYHWVIYTNNDLRWFLDGDANLRWVLTKLKDTTRHPDRLKSIGIKLMRIVAAFQTNVAYLTKFAELKFGKKLATILISQISHLRDGLERITDVELYAIECDMRLKIFKKFL
jgi:hypothetical protein